MKQELDQVIKEINRHYDPNNPNGYFATGRPLHPRLKRLYSFYDGALKVYRCRGSFGSVYVRNRVTNRREYLEVSG